ncbi:MAG: acyl-CoA thioester hydrolase [Flavobacteriaceae bacterium]|jgi:acyl-CoA thioester hydrolase
MKYKTRQITVRYSETDQMQFVHHSNYLKYFEMARLEWLTALGISYAAMEKEGILMPVVSAALVFKAPLYFGNQFQVSVVLKKIPRVTLAFDYSITNQKDEIVCEGNTVLAFLSPNNNRPMRCPKILLEKFS